jgi:hypothetical protein
MVLWLHPYWNVINPLAERCKSRLRTPSVTPDVVPAPGRATATASQSGEAATSRVSERWATANVRTLIPAQEECSYAQNSVSLLMSKVQALEISFREHSLSWVAIQEGRSRREGIRDGLHYLMYMAPADEFGGLGVQIWRAREPSFSTILWRAVSPRILFHVARLNSGAISVVISAHSPVEVSADKDKLQRSKDDFWESLWKCTSDLCSRFPNAMMQVGIDGNGKVGSVTSTAIGTVLPAIESPNGARLRSYAEAFGFRLINSFFANAGYTWTSSYGTVSRIDYLMARDPLFSCVEQCSTPDSIDLSFTSALDHKAVVADVRYSPGDFMQAAPLPKVFTLNKAALADPDKCEAFQQDMWGYSPPQEAHIDDHLDHLNTTVTELAKVHFGTSRSTPRKQWISAETWRLLRFIAPARRAMGRLAGRASFAMIRGVFAAWRSHQCGSSMSGHRSSSWVAVGDASDSFSSMRRDCLAVAGFRQWIRMLQRALRPQLENDRQAFLDNLVIKAHNCCVAGDAKGSFAIVRALGGARSCPNTAIKKLDGSLTQSPEEEAARWEEHHSQVFRGTIVSADDVRSKELPAVNGEPDLDVGPEQTERAFRSLGKNKGVGIDRIPAELLQAGGSPVAVAYAGVNVRAAQTWVWPSQWCGGMLPSIYKKKGDSQDCDSSRGILLADHAGKGLASLVKEAIDPIYERKVPETQFGAVRGRGTDMATHIALSSAHYAQVMQLSIAMIFLDLVKAFDRIVRQLVVGWGRTPPVDKHAYLRGLGLPPGAAEWVANYLVRHGDLLSQWGVGVTARGLAWGLHDNSWFMVPGGSNRIRSMTGGRQGCKLGATMFNSAYTIGLDLLHWRLAELGIRLRVRSADSSFWMKPSQDDAPRWTHILDVTFVDDEMIALVASSPETLDRTIDTVLEVLLCTFGDMHLELNWKAGKSEAIVVYRGHGAVAARAKLEQPDGKLAIPLPGGRGRLLVVSHYQHLGTIICGTGESYLNIARRVSSTMATFIPLAWKLFGNQHLGVRYKVAFAYSLLYSKLFFNVHIGVYKPREVRKLHTMQMRILRRIYGQPRFEHTENTDLEIRRAFDADSVDCLLMVARLRYLGRLIASQPKQLLALLAHRVPHINGSDTRMPWVNLAVADTVRLKLLGAVPHDTPSIDDDPTLWTDLILSDEWKATLQQVHFVESTYDPGPAVVNGSPLNCVCPQCRVAFATERALASHQRAKHGSRMAIRTFVEGTVCVACGTDYRQRLRLIAHLSDSRRPRCRNWIVANTSPLSPARVCELDDEDRVARNDARAQGHTHEIARGAARRADGRIVGRVS